MKREDIAAQLVRTAEQRVAAMEARQAATEAFAKLIPLAYRAGIGVTEIARLTGLSRRSVYDALDSAAGR
jgi:DNA-binding phage protein